MPVRVQLVRPVAAEVYARAFWGDTSGGASPCPGPKGYHDTKRLLLRLEDPDADHGLSLGEVLADPGLWYPGCAHCGAPVAEAAEEGPGRINRHLAHVTVYRGDLDGEERAGLHGLPGSRFGLRPGDAYWSPWLHSGTAPDGEAEEDLRGGVPTQPASARCPSGWSNCADARGHLHLVLPDGKHFDTASRAANCSRPKDRRHRCWTVSGTPEGGDLTLGKGGDTCKAGAGSVDTGTWHGFVRDGTMSP